MKPWLLVTIGTFFALGSAYCYTESLKPVYIPEAFQEKAEDLTLLSEEELQRRLKAGNIYGKAYRGHAMVFEGQIADVADIEAAVDAYKRGEVPGTVSGMSQYFAGLRRKRDGEEIPEKAEEPGEVDGPAPEKPEGGGIIAKHVRAVYNLTGAKVDPEVMRKNIAGIRTGLMSLVDLYKNVMLNEGFEIPDKPPRPGGAFNMVDADKPAREQPYKDRTNMAEIGRQKIEALYENLQQTPTNDPTKSYDSVATKDMDLISMDIMVDLYVEYDGDMARVENLLKTIMAIADAESEGTDSDASTYMQYVAQAVYAGVPKDDVYNSLVDWKRFEMERATRRPNATLIGPGEGMLSRPWKGAAEKLYHSVSYNRDDLQPYNSVDGTGSVAPGTSEAMIGQADWMFA